MKRDNLDHPKPQLLLKYTEVHHLPLMVAASSDVEEASVLEVYLVWYVDHEVVPPDGATHLPPCMSVVQCSSASGGFAIQ